MLFYTGCPLPAVHWLHWNARAWSSSEGIVKFKFLLKGSTVYVSKIIRVFAILCALGLDKD